MTMPPNPPSGQPPLPPRPHGPGPAGNQPSFNPAPYAGGPQPPFGTQPGPGQPPGGPGTSVPPSPFPQPPAAPLGQQPPTKSRARGRIVAIVLAVLVLIVAGLIGLGWYTTNQREQASHAAMVGLLAALQSGDATTALSYLDDSTIDAQTHPLLTDSVLAANQETFSFNEDLTKIESTSTAYKYRASISINGTDKVVEWSVVDAGDDWLVSTSDVFTRLSLDAELPHVINGTTVEAGTTEVTLLPGSYTVESGMPLLFYAPGTASFDLFTGGNSQFTGELVMADGIKDPVVEQVRNILNGCAAEKSPPTACNWPLPFDNGVVRDGTVTWTIIPADPAAELTLPTGPWLASSGYTSSFTISYETDATGEGVLNDGTEGYFDEYLEPRSSTFDLDLSGSEPVVSLA